MSDNILIQAFAAILGNDNEARKQAESLIYQARAEPLSYTKSLLEILSTSQDVGVRQLAAVLLRKDLSIATSELSDESLWNKLELATRTEVKTSVLQLLENEPERVVRNRISDAVSELALSVTEDEAWDDLLPTLFRFVTSANEGLIESALRIFKNVFLFLTDAFMEKKESLFEIYRAALPHGNNNIKAAAIESLATLLEIIPKEQCAEFLFLLDALLEATKFLVDNDVDKGREALVQLNAIAEAEPLFYKKDLAKVYQYGIAFCVNKDEERDIRKLSFDLLCALAQRLPKQFENSMEMTSNYCGTLFEFMIDIDETVDEEWLSPPEGFVQDEVDQDDDNTEFGMNCFDKMICCIGDEVMLPVLYNLVQQALQQEDWRFKFASLMTLSQVGEYIDSEDTKKLTELITLVTSHMSHEHPKIRYAALHCIGQCSEDLAPELQNEFHAVIMAPLLVALDDQCPRVRAHAGAAVANFAELCPKEIITPYLATFLPKLFNAIETGTSIVKENAISALSSFCDAAKENYADYFDQSVPVLFQLAMKFQEREYKEFRGQLFECITLMAIAVGKEPFMKYVEDIINAMVDIQENSLEEVDPQRTYLLTAWQRIAMLLKADLIPYLGKIIPSLYKMACINPEMGLSNSPGLLQKLETMLSDEDGKDKKNVNTYETEEKEQGIQLLTVLIDELKGGFADFITETGRILLPMVNYTSSDNVRMSASSALPGLILSAKDSGKFDEQQIATSALTFLEVLWSAAATEIDTEVITAQLDAMKLIYTHAPDRFLSQENVSNHGDKLFAMYEKSVERMRKFQCMDNLDEDEQTLVVDDTSNEEDLQVGIAEVLASLIKSHGELTLGLVKRFAHDVLPEILKPEAQPCDHRFGIFVIDDMIENLGLQHVPEEWAALKGHLFTHAIDANCNVRQAAVYGIGQLAMKGGDFFLPEAENCIQLLCQAAQMQIKKDDSKKSYGNAKDNAISSLGKIVRHHSASVDYTKLVPFWLENLPLKHDHEEAQIQHELLLDILISSPNLILGENAENMKGVLTIFGSILENVNLCNAETDKKINQVLTGFRADANLGELVNQHTASMNPLERNRLVNNLGRYSSN